MKSKQEKLTYRECAKDLRKLRNVKKLGHQKTLMIAILELEKLARAEEAKAKSCSCSCGKKK